LETDPYEPAVAGVVIDERPRTSGLTLEDRFESRRMPAVVIDSDGGSRAGRGRPL
jgi:hypothetical protein